MCHSICHKLHNTNFSLRHTGTSVLAILLLVYTVPGKAQNSVRVISSEANIYTKPSLFVSQSIQAQKGDIFEVESYNDDWVAIHMFSGAIRRIKKSEVEFVREIPFHFSSPSMQIKLCKEIQKAQTRAASEAVSRYPRQAERQTMYENLLFDKYILNLYRNYDIPASHNTIILDCINDSIIGPIEL